MSQNENEIAHPLEQEQQSNEATLSKNDTMKVLTPFAFKIDQSLFGLSLATPSRRLIALCIDLFLVALLSDAPGELLALFLAITFYRVSKVKFDNSEQAQADGSAKKGRKRKKFATWLAAFFLFIALVNILPSIIDPFNEPEQTTQDMNNTPVLEGDEELSVEQAIALTTTTGVIITSMSSDPCSDLDCWKSEITRHLELLDGIPFKKSVLTQLYGELAENTALTINEQTHLRDYLVDYHQRELLPVQLTDEATDESTVNDSDTELSERIDQVAKLDEIVPTVNQSIDSENTPNKDSKPIYSIVKYIEGIIQDLGLGFGWAAFYFTVFTSAWHGQTPGKKLVGIKVIQLDGTPLSLWDSFGRYGGYGAGIATGLLGFFQIFWDSNRQAIHDKISATVVIDHDRKQPSRYQSSPSQNINKKEETNND